jgi:cytosine/adenosine deaminase-related metal-dependent hydrolase
MARRARIPLFITQGCEQQMELLVVLCLHDNRPQPLHCHCSDAEIENSYHSFEREKQFFIRAGALMKISFF